MAEIAQAYVSLVTRMPNVQSDISKAVGSAAIPAGNAFSQALGKVKVPAPTIDLSKYQASLDSARRSAESAANAEKAAADKVRVAQAQLADVTAQAAQKAAAASAAQQNAAGKVKLAQQQLADAIKKGGEESTKALAAKERLAAAERALEVATKSQGSSQAALAAAQAKVADAQRGLNTATANRQRALEGVTAAEKAFGAAQTQAASQGVSAASKLSAAWGSATEKIKSGAEKAAKAIGSGLQSAATATMAAVGAGLGTALAKGFKRLDSIDNAKAKLAGLGNSAADVDAIMKNALASVSGTAFGLDEAATVAASAVAAGIKPGAELESVLKTVANSAAAASTNMDEMGAVFNQVASKGKADTGDLNQLANRGIPIWQKLGEQYGVNQEQLRDMVAGGKVSFADFAKAAESASGSVATAMGKTFSGALRNFNANLAKLGAGLLDGLFPKLAPLFLALNAAMQPLIPLATKLGGEIGDRLGPAVDRLTAWIEGLGKASGGLKAKLSGVLPVLAPLTAAFAALGAGGLGQLIAKIPLLGSLLPGLGGALSALGSPVGIVVAAVGALVATNPQLREFASSVLGGVIDGLKSLAAGVTGLDIVTADNSFTQFMYGLGTNLADIGKAGQDAFKTIGDALSGATVDVEAFRPHVDAMLQAFGDLGNTVGPVVSSVVQSLGDALAACVPYLQTIGERLAPVIIDMFTQMAPVLGDIVTHVGEMVQKVAELIAPLLQLASVILPPIASIVGGTLSSAFQFLGTIVGALVPIFDGVVTELHGFIDFVTGVFSGNWSQAMNGIREIAASQWEIIKGIFTGALDIIFGFFRNAFGQMTAVIDGFFPGAQGIMDAGWSNIKGLTTGALAAVLGAISAAWSSAVSVTSSAWSSVVSFLSGAWESAKAAVSAGVDGVMSYVNGLPGRISGALGNLGDLLWGAGASIMEGFLGGLKSAWGAVTDFVGGVADWIAAHKGPLSYDAVLLRPAGLAIMGGLDKAMRSMMPQLGSTLSDVTSLIEGTSAEITPFGSGRAGATGGQTIYYQPQVSEHLSALREWERFQTAVGREVVSW